MQGSLLEKQKKGPIQGRLTIKYEGNDSKDHSLDSELYATSILGFTQAFKKTNKILLGIDTEVKIEAERGGCLIADIFFFLEQYQSHAAVINTWIDLIQKSIEVTIEASTCIYFIFRKILEIIKASKGNKTQIQHEVNKLHLDDKMSQKLFKLLTNRQFRKNLDQLTLFLGCLDMDYLEIRESEKETFYITQKERIYYAENPEDEIEITTDDSIVSVVYPSANRTKWQFMINGKELWANITDTGFIQIMQDKPLDYFENIQFHATVKTTSILKANKSQPEISREIYNLKTYFQPEQLPLPHK